MPLPGLISVTEAREQVGAKEHELYYRGLEEPPVLRFYSIVAGVGACQLPRETLEQLQPERTWLTL